MFKHSKLISNSLRIIFVLGGICWVSELANFPKWNVNGSDLNDIQHIAMGLDSRRQCSLRSNTVQYAMGRGFVFKQHITINEVIIFYSIHCYTYYIHTLVL